MTIRDEDIAQLTSMGFPEANARNALKATNGDVGMAVDRLLSGEGFGGDNSVDDGFASSAVAISPVSSSAGTVVRGSTSQYSYGCDGRSACTCIALTAAELISKASANNGNDESTIITTELLDCSIEEGVARYMKLRSVSGSNNVEHMSADEVLQKVGGGGNSGNSGNNNNNCDSGIFHVRLAGGVRQGALSSDVNHPLGMKFVLEGLVNDVRREQQERGPQSVGDTKISTVNSSPMICVLLTKSPETVLLCLPSHDITNDSTNGVTNQKQQYWLVDSHPRPQLLPGVETSYAKPHNTLTSLLQSLRDTFPFTDLGPDIPPMMADMYNMFDMYALEGRKHGADC
jgi:hypothetical protein